ncbi:MAG: hypothetical protein AAGC69_23915 [Paracraurococcus sp.]
MAKTCTAGRGCHSTPIFAQHLGPGDESDGRQHPEAVLGEGLVVLRALHPVRRLRAARAAGVDVLQRVVGAGEVAPADHQLAAEPGQLVALRPARRDAPGQPVLVDHLEDRVVELLMGDPAVHIHLTRIEADAGAVGEALGPEIARLVAADGGGAGDLRPVQRIAQGEGAGQLLPDDVGAGVEARLHPIVDAVAEIGVELLVLAAAVLPPAVGMGDAAGRQRVPVAEDRRGLAREPPGAVSAAAVLL